MNYNSRLGRVIDAQSLKNSCRKSTTLYSRWHPNPVFVITQFSDPKLMQVQWLLTKRPPSSYCLREAVQNYFLITKYRLLNTAYHLLIPVTQETKLRVVAERELVGLGADRRAVNDHVATDQAVLDAAADVADLAVLENDRARDL